MIKTIIFDLGNVVFSCSFDHAFNYWAKILNCNIVDVKNNFVFDKQHEAFEIGLISTKEFYYHVNKFYSGNLKYDDFCNGWNSIYEDVYQDIEMILNNLKVNYKIIALTNTNELHATVWKKKYEFILNLTFRGFENTFFRISSLEKS